MAEGSRPRWTPEQEAAITARGQNLLVAAAAGAGKTATLVQRLIRRITDPGDPVDVDRLLVVTFTEAAAAEMRERIAAALQAALAADTDNGRLQRQLTLLGRAEISTLHSFCLRLLRRHFYRLGLDPAVTVMGEHETMLLRREVLDDLFAQRYEAEEAGSPFYALVDRYAGQRDDEGLGRLVLAVFGYVQSLPWPAAWLQEAAARFALPAGAAIETLPWWEPICRQIGLRLEQAARSLAMAAGRAARPRGPGAYLGALQSELEQVRAAAALAARSGSGWEELAAAVRAVAFGRLPAVRSDGVDPGLKEGAQRWRDGAKKLLHELSETFFDREAQAWLDDLSAVAPHVDALITLVEQFEQAYTAAKARQAAVDFNDLERYCLQLLLDPAAPPGEFCPSEVAGELRRRYEEVLVDEYQDINGVQDAILTLVARGDNRFMVGDVKQSIYRFRQTDPSHFLAKYLAYGSGDGGQRIVLGANFRSRRSVVDAVNFLFRQILTARVGELEYDHAAELIARADYPPLPGTDPAAGAAPVELHLLEREVPEGEDEALAALANWTALEREAALVARRVRELVQGTPEQPPLQVWDPQAGIYRPARYRDVVVLLRATTGRVGAFVEALGRVGVPAYAQASTGYFAATEVEVFLSLLQVLDNPRQDIPLAAVLRSPLLGLSAADLATIRTAAPAEGFYDAMVAASQAAADGEGPAERLRGFLHRLETWRTAARRQPLSTVIWRIFRESGYLHYVGGMPGGQQRHANLLALYERAREFDRFARQGLFRFLRFVERLRESEADLGTAPALGEGEDVVRIISIHKSKGLEFPVVFVADLGKAFGQQDLQGDLLLERNLGFGPQLIDPDLRVKYPTLAYHAVRETVRLQALAEEMRVLYVALTRARERLILVGSAAGLAEECQRWVLAATTAAGEAGPPAAAGSGPLPDAALAGAHSYLDWLVPALVRHRDGGPVQVAAGGAEAGAAVAAEPSRWQVCLWRAGDLAGLVEPAAPPAEGPGLDWERILRLQPLDRPISSPVPAETARRFAWRYPYSELAQRFAKQTVTELKGHFDPDAGIDASHRPPEVDGHAAAAPPAAAAGGSERRPRFLQETPDELTAAEFGTLMHLVLQHLDLTAPLDRSDLCAQVDRLVERELITPAQAEAVDLQAIAALFSSPLGQRIRAGANRVRREVAFTLALPAVEIYPDLGPGVPAGETVIVQGMIDLLIEGPQGYLLVDFKTDRRDPEAAAGQYRGQVALYRRAVAEILGKPVSEAYLYFLAANRSVAV